MTDDERQAEYRVYRATDQPGEPLVSDLLARPGPSPVDDVFGIAELEQQVADLERRLAEAEAERDRLRLDALLDIPTADGWYTSGRVYYVHQGAIRHIVSGVIAGPFNDVASAQAARDTKRVADLERRLAEAEAERDRLADELVRLKAVLGGMTETSKRAFHKYAKKSHQFRRGVEQYRAKRDALIAERDRLALVVAAVLAWFDAKADLARCDGTTERAVVAEAGAEVARTAARLRGAVAHYRSLDVPS
jgi:DNA repair exonuclease SbcCD ATPase subunit